MVVTDSTYNLWSSERNKTRNPHDLGAEELFLTQYKQSEEFSRASNDYYSQLYDGVQRRNNMSFPVSQTEMFRLHRHGYGKRCPMNVLLPRGESIIDSVTVDQQNTKSWKQPVLQKLFVPPDLQIHEFDIGNYDSSDFQVAQIELDEAISANQAAHFNVQPLPFLLETILIPAKEYLRLIKGRDSAYSSCHILSSLDDDNLVEVPARFMVGDGDAVAISLKFGWEEISSANSYDAQSRVRQFMYHFGRIQMEMRIFLSNLPTLYSTDADSKINCLIKFISDAYGIDISLKCVDLGAIAVAAGARMDVFNIFTLSTATLGIAFPAGIDNLDQSWSSPLNKLSPDLWKFVTEKFKLLSTIYATLMGSLLRNMFPDPNIVCLALRMSQSTFVPWFAEFVASALQHALLHTDSHRCVSRADMIRAIIHPAVIEGEMLADLIINVPVAQCGGERYLHHAMYMFFSQFDVLKSVWLRSYSGDHPRPQEDFSAQRYDLMFKRNYVNNDFHLSVAPGDKGLLPSPQFQDLVYEYNAYTAIGRGVIDPYFDDNRHVISAVQEWGRLNVDQIPVLMAKLRKLSFDDLKLFWVENIRAYEYLRGVVMRVKGERHTVFKLDQIITGRCENVVNLYQKTEHKRVYYSKRFPDHQLLYNQQRRVNLLNERYAYLEGENRVGVHQDIHRVVPGDFKWRNNDITKFRKRRVEKRRRDDPNFVSQTKWKREKKLRIVDQLKEKFKVGLSSCGRSPSPVGYNRLPCPGPALQVVIKNPVNSSVDDFGPDEDLPLEGLLERLKKNPYGYEVCCNSDKGALAYLIRNRTCGEVHLYEKWKKLRVVELENRVAKR